MKDIQYVILSKDNFNAFISRLSKLQKLVAPVAKGYKNYAFEEVTSGDQIAVKYIPTVLPPKKYFLPQRETLLEYNLSQGLDVRAVLEYERMALFGVHTCDLAGIQCLNMVFSRRPKDYNYLIRKNKIDIIGIECNEYCDEFASCSLVNANTPSGGYDLFCTDMGDYFIVHINTQVGDEIVDAAKVFERADMAHLRELVKLRENKRAIFRNELPVDPRGIPELFDKSFESEVWKDLDRRCLACGNCTNVCPTCYCFDIIDEMNLELKGGRRYRRWDSCQLEPFAKVAGGENFRKERAARQRHRYYCKFRYPVLKYARFFCTGCGRCSRTCMAGIKLKETLNTLIEEGITKVWKKWL
ncbi:MAG: 4Fe-4S dicluster domain-containing protein [Nitrospirae bacterium]|nr:4Fe-4S dicluster domain-containing protein [Nitrospirota bacterium]